MEDQTTTKSPEQELEDAFAPASESLKVSPEIVEFVWEANATLQTNLRICNTSEQPMAFKIKTTAPKSYLVRPSAGVLDVNEEYEILLVHQPVKDKPTNNQDRFLIQFLNVKKKASLSKEAWAKVPKDHYKDKRLVVRFKDESEAAPRKTEFLGNFRPSDYQSGSPRGSVSISQQVDEEKARESQEEIDRLRRAVADLSARGPSSRSPSQRVQGGSFMVAVFLLGALFGVFLDRMLFRANS